jgi:hypothetical protein
MSTLRDRPVTVMSLPLKRAIRVVWLLALNG